jgi:glucose-1-phosphate adenylyltransferase
MELILAAPDLDMYDRRWPIWTHQEQLAPAKFLCQAYSAAAADSLVSSGRVVSGGTIRRSVLFSNTRIAERSVVEDSVLLPEVEIGRHVQLRKVVVDMCCRILDGLRAGVDPVQDRQRFQVSEGGVTLVTPAMLGQA